VTPELTSCLRWSLKSDVIQDEIQYDINDLICDLTRVLMPVVTIQDNRNAILLLRS
jgi:hypothetical protein